MFVSRLSPGQASVIKQLRLPVIALWLLYILATVQFIGVYLYLEFPYIDVHRFEQGYERLPFQTRLLLAPLFSWADHTHWFVKYVSRLAYNNYFFPRGVHPSEVVQFYLGIPCVLIAGWVATRIHRAATRTNLLRALVYPLFLALCVVSYILHTVQNFRFVYDMPSLAFFALGLYLIYFRKPTLLLIALFAIATLNRETTALLLPFFMLTEGLDIKTRRFNWRRLISGRVVGVVFPLTVYWLLWHHIIFHAFRFNASEYYPRIQFNIYCFTRLRYYPQLFSSLGFLVPFLILYRRYLRDAQLRLWMWVIPVWYAFMFTYGILVETRVFGELLPFVAAITILMSEELVIERVRGLSKPALMGDEDEQRRIHIARAA